MKTNPRSYSETKKKQNQELEKFLGPLPGADNPLVQHAEQLAHDYLAIPEALRDIWHRSDTQSRKSAHWQETLQRAEAATQNALQLCHAHKADEDTTSPQALQQQHNQISAAIHALEAIREELRLMFPMPHSREDVNTHEAEPSNDYIPKLIVNTDDCIIIQLRALPRYSKVEQNHLLSGFRTLLRTHDFAQFLYWHCDFIHVFHPETKHGIYDADNYPYKPFIDTLTKALNTYDGEDHFSYAAYNHITNTIHPGCYIRITKRCEKVGFFADFENQILAHTTT